MSIADSLLMEFEQEVETTRKFLQQLPDDKLDWKPHEKSLTAGQLALHIAKTPGNVAEMATQLEYPVENMKGPTEQPESAQQVLDALDASIATVRDTLPTFSDAQMSETWSAVSGGEPFFSLPRAGLLRTIMLNHWYHHRGQFGVYLRLMGCFVPSSYGPSGDEVPDFMKNIPMPTGSGA